MVASTTPGVRKEPPDPALGITLVIIGIVTMGIGGAATWHYVFNIGSGIAILGAVLFVTFVTWSTYALRGTETLRGAEALGGGGSTGSTESLRPSDPSKTERTKPTADEG